MRLAGLGGMRGTAVAVLVSLGVTACAFENAPDITRTEKLPGETHSPAEQFRILSSGNELSGAYFLDRGKVEGGIEVFGGQSSEEEKRKAEELQARVERLEAQATATTEPAAPVTSGAKPDNIPVAGAAAAGSVKAEATASNRVKSDAKVQQDTSIDPDVPASVKGRLRLLMELKDEKLITEDQYREKVKEILDRL